MQNKGNFDTLTAMRTCSSASGRQKVEMQYSIQATGPRLAGLLKDAAKSSRGSK